jgi:hypothetical protein
MPLAAFIDDKEANRIPRGNMHFGGRESKILGNDADALFPRFASGQCRDQNPYHSHP